MNSVCVSGRLTRDPELLSTPSGKAMCRFAIATNDRKKEGDVWVDAPTFLDMTAWGKRAETLAEYRRKGDMLIVEGRLRVESWDDKKTGSKRSKLVLAPDRIEWPSKGENQARSGTTAPAQSPAAETEDDDVPF